MNIIEEIVVKNIFFLICICASLTSFTAEKNLNIQEKNQKVISLKQHTREIYLLESKHAQEKARYQAQIASLHEALEQARNPRTIAKLTSPMIESFRGTFY